MRYMVIETFKTGMKSDVYRRLNERGRMLPAGLEYIDSWVEQGGNRAFQLMATDDIELFDIWISRWNDLVEFEVVPVAPTPTAD